MPLYSYCNLYSILQNGYFIKHLQSLCFCRTWHLRSLLLCGPLSPLLELLSFGALQNFGKSSFQKTVLQTRSNCLFFISFPPLDILRKKELMICKFLSISRFYCYFSSLLCLLCFLVSYYIRITCLFTRRVWYRFIKLLCMVWCIEEGVS